MKYRINIYLLCVASFWSLLSCSDTMTDIPFANNGIEVQEDGGLIDGISGQISPFELVDQPEYRTLEETDYLSEDALVFIIKSSNDDIYIFPHQNMLVELVNDVIGDVPVAINFCPLTGTGMAWDRRAGPDTLLLRASGLLYRDNLVVQDSITGSLWLQMKRTGVSGPLADHRPKTLPLVQTSWSVARNNFRNALVFYHDCDSICVPRNSGNGDQTGLFEKYEDGTLIYGLVDPFGNISAFHFDDFENDLGLIVQGQKIIVGYRSYEMILSFNSDYHFTIIKNAFPVILRDESGSRWNIFGEAIDGPKKGEKLEDGGGFYAYKQAWEQVFSDLE